MFPNRLSVVLFAAINNLLEGFPSPFWKVIRLEIRRQPIKDVCQTVKQGWHVDQSKSLTFLTMLFYGFGKVTNGFFVGSDRDTAPVLMDSTVSHRVRSSWRPIDQPCSRL